MKIKFDKRLDAVDWIAEYAEDEGQFEALREQLNYNFIYHQEYFLEIDDRLDEIVSFPEERNA